MWRVCTVVVCWAEIPSWSISACRPFTWSLLLSLDAPTNKPAAPTVPTLTHTRIPMRTRIAPSRTYITLPWSSSFSSSLEYGVMGRSLKIRPGYKRKKWCSLIKHPPQSNQIQWTGEHRYVLDSLDNRAAGLRWLPWPPCLRANFHLGLMFTAV